MIGRANTFMCAGQLLRSNEQTQHEADLARHAMIGAQERRDCDWGTCRVQ